MSKFGSSNVKLRASLFDIGYVPEIWEGAFWRQVHSAWNFINTLCSHSPLISLRFRLDFPVERPVFDIHGKKIVGSQLKSGFYQLRTVLENWEPWVLSSCQPVDPRDVTGKARV